jgi:hypothetical protein
MFHVHIGMNSWNSTAAALAMLDNTAEENGFVVDRAEICLDRRMGLPKAHQKNIPAETGPMLDSIKDWKQIGQTDRRRRIHGIKAAYHCIYRRGAHHQHYS